MARLRIKVSLTWDEQGWLWFAMPRYRSIGIGPLFIELDWSGGRDPFESWKGR